jgi:alkylation response protein AidB-like acyl-CoA dehydrogenase
MPCHRFHGGPGEAALCVLRGDGSPRCARSQRPFFGPLIEPRLQCEASARKRARWSRWNRQDNPSADIHTEGLDAETPASTLEPGTDSLNRVFMDRTLVGRAVLHVAERAMEASGGSGFYRAAGLERLFRDIQGVRYHRPQERMQVRYSGELALCREPAG